MKFRLANLMPGPKPNAGRGGDIEIQGMIRGQPNYEDDIGNAHKDEEKPWKKPGLFDGVYFSHLNEKRSI